MTRITDTISRPTRFGFEFGPIKVIRITNYDNGGVAIGINGIESPDFGPFILEIYASPKGKRVRVFRNGKELK